MNPKNRKRVVVAMSGGVDSSVAAALLVESGCEVIGVTMRLYEAPSDSLGSLSKSCCGFEDVEDARTACRLIGARHYFMNFERQFKEHVIDYFVSEYEKGRTPYPCLACNDRMKFDFLLKRAISLGADTLATGHYSRIEDRASSRSLLRGLDRAKDQSYALFNLNQNQLRRLEFPIGRFTKGETRELAQRFGLPNADKPDSQDICFIPLGDYRSYVEKRLRRGRPGEVVDSTGRFVAKHPGIHNFTVGQRKGIPGSGLDNRPTYVTSIDAQTGTVTVGHAEELLTNRIKVGSVNWVSGHAPISSRRITAKIRYRSPEVRVCVGQGARGETVAFTAEPVRAATPGQAIVFYDGDVVLGGGIIEGCHAVAELQQDRIPQAQEVTPKGLPRESVSTTTAFEIGVGT